MIQILTSFQDPGIDDSAQTRRLCYHRSYRHMVNCTCHGNAFAAAVLDDKRPVRLGVPCMQDIMQPE